ncbi:hypothetical protein DUC50_RS12075 [Enterococcus hirae]|uniref:hypothetical protein n=1 Tax=Enterococcus TaxID=1350 RepID=UPI0019FA92EF|nr:hypothetical protein [Enterococcus hirae]EMF0108647.1 hypothetical protein [Enterococcus hirae]EMF0201429.1 hypothetical protein [Enterococcus hirae]EMF0377763.1 hypothetical protein [Enterococcus hirae]EMF0406455.1 hypothetical protein [Enterococcus hirae]EMF0421329.1 hypothetical protein [Enterococcus hirae]
MENNQETLETIHGDLIAIANNLGFYDSETFHKKISEETKKTLSKDNKQLTKEKLEVAVMNLTEMIPNTIKTKLKADERLVASKSSRLFTRAVSEKKQDSDGILQDILAYNKSISDGVESLKKARPHEREQLISSIEEGWEAAKNNLNLLKKDEGIAPDGMTNTAVIESLLFQRKNFLNTYHMIHQVREQLGLKQIRRQDLSVGANSQNSSVSLVEGVKMKFKEFQKKRQESLKNSSEDNTIPSSQFTSQEQNGNPAVDDNVYDEPVEYGEVGIYGENENPEELNPRSNAVDDNVYGEPVEYDEVDIYGENGNPEELNPRPSAVAAHVYGESVEYGEVDSYRENGNLEELNPRPSNASTTSSISFSIYDEVADINNDYEVVDNNRDQGPKPELWQSMNSLRKEKQKLYKEIIQLSKEHKVGTKEFSEKVERLLDIRYKIAIKKELIQKVGFDFTKILNNSRLLGRDNPDMINKYDDAISNFINQKKTDIPQVTTDNTKDDNKKKIAKLYQEMKHQFNTDKTLSGRKSAEDIYPLIVEALNKNIPNNLSTYDYYDLSKSKTLKKAGLHKWGNVEKILDASNRLKFNYPSPDTKNLQYVKQSKKELKELELVFNKQVTKFYKLFKNAKTSLNKDVHEKEFITNLSNLRDIHHQLETRKTIERMLGMDYEKFCHKFAERNNVDPQKIIHAWQETAATQLKDKSPNLVDDFTQEVSKRFQDVTRSADPLSVGKLNEFFNMDLYKARIAKKYLDSKKVDYAQDRAWIINKVNYIKRLDKEGSYKRANEEFIKLLPEIDKLLNQYTLIEQPFYHINTPINECPTLKNLGIKDCREYLPDPVKKIEPLYAEVNKNKGMNPENAQGRLLNIINGAQSKVQQDAQNQQLDPSKGKPSNDLLRETSV